MAHFQNVNMKATMLSATRSLVNKTLTETLGTYGYINFAEMPPHAALNSRAVGLSFLAFCLFVCSFVLL